MTNEIQIQNDTVKKKEHFNLSIFLLVLLLAVGIVVFELLGADPVSLNPSSPEMSEPQARTIAEISCVKGGEVLGQGVYNENSKTWWFDTNMNATKEGCSPACVVSEEKKTAEINLRCTEVVAPLPEDEDAQVFCTMDAKICPDGSAVGRVGPKCEFAPCPPVSDNSDITVSLVLNEPFFVNEEEFIMPLEIVEDSRCPVGAECVLAGQVSALITMQSEREGMERLQLNQNEQFVFAGKRITLVEVAPTPRVSGEILEHEYVLTFTVQ